LYIIRRATPEEVKKLRYIANYQFREEVAHYLIPEDIYVKISRNTGRVREVLSDEGIRIASIRASTYTFNLSLYGASILHKVTKKLRVVITSEVAEDVVKGSSIFSRHIMSVDEDLRAGDEVLVVDECDNLLCVGRLVLSPYEVMFFTRGVAVKLRECRGVLSEC
jgi:uncharacterized protein with predicted RNA binding PUA domain